MVRTIIFILLSLSIKAQIQNPGFELMYSCPDYISTEPIGWRSICGDIDLISTCDTSDNQDYYDVGAPLNWFGNQNPQEGNNYIALCTYITSYPNVREWVEAPIQLQDTCYSIILYVSLADNSSHATSLSLYFSEYPLSEAQNFPDFNQLNTNKIVNIPTITDTAKWIPVQLLYQASHNDKYLYIGNFRKDEESTIIQFNPMGFNMCYYFIDNIIIEPTSCTTYIQEIPYISPVKKYKYNILGQQIHD